MKSQIGIRLPESVRDRLEKECKRRDVTISEFCRQAIIENEQKTGGIALSDDNLKFLKTFAELKGWSLTETTNHLLHNLQISFNKLVT